MDSDTQCNVWHADVVVQIHDCLWQDNVTVKGQRDSRCNSGLSYFFQHPSGNSRPVTSIASRGMWTATLL